MDLGDTYSPEKKLTLVALRLAILEKAASGVGALGFIWATAVLLGGIAVALERTDFYVVTAILLVEGARIFSRSHELEWQQSTWSLVELSGFLTSNDLMSLTNPTGRSPESYNLHPCSIHVFNSSSMSRLLYWLQLFSATACVFLSTMRLAQQNYSDIAGADESTIRNLRPALNIFYSLSLVEALLFLAERAYLEWKLRRCHLLEQVSRESGLGPTELISVRRFFYNAYSRCINGSIFDGMKMNMVSFGEELLISDSRDEQLIGARMLLRFADKAMRRIGISVVVMERLVEMLNWRSSGEEEIRTAAAAVVSKLAGKKRNGIRVAGISGAMESIASLLYTENYASNEEVIHRQTTADRQETNHYHTFNLLGLLILKKLAKDPDNRAKIGRTKNLIPKIIDFTTAVIPKLHHRNPIAGIEREIKAAKRALQVLKLLASTTGRTGETLRREISEFIFTISNIREVLKHCGEDDILKPLQKLGVEIITYLAMDEAARESIGATGGMMRELLRIFLDCGGLDGQVRVEAGDALAMLVVQSRRNCGRVLSAGENVAARLVEEAGDSLVGVNACQILTYLCAYGDAAHDFRTREELIKAFPMVLNNAMFWTAKQLEASIGFIVQIVRFMSPIEFVDVLERVNVLETELIKLLVYMLQQYNYPSITTPSMRRNVIELSNWLMQFNEKYITLFRNYGMEKELRGVAETTSDIESFIVFYGYVGLTRYGTTMTALIETAWGLLGKNIP